MWHNIWNTWPTHLERRQRNLFYWQKTRNFTRRTSMRSCKDSQCKKMITGGNDGRWRRTWTNWSIVKLRFKHNRKSSRMITSSDVKPCVNTECQKHGGEQYLLQFITSVWVRKEWLRKIFSIPRKTRTWHKKEKHAVSTAAGTLWNSSLTLFKATFENDIVQPEVINDEVSYVNLLPLRSDWLSIQERCWC